MAVTKELLQMDLYALLGIEEKAEDKEVKKAYRQKALSCHPDKNPDNPRAAELFHQLSQALEVLTDAAARAAYDKVRKARKQAAERTQKLDERRKKVKLDLEARERQAQALGSEEEEESGSATTLEQEIERLREEGSRQLEEQQRLIREQIRQEQEQRLRGMAENPENKETPKLKLKWKSKKEAESQGGYSRDVLLRLFQKYGEVLDLVLSSKKAGTAVVEFATVKAAELAVQNEVGLVDNPLKISWLEGRPQSAMGHNHPGLSRPQCSGPWWAARLSSSCVSGVRNSEVHQLGVLQEALCSAAPPDLAFFCATPGGLHLYSHSFSCKEGGSGSKTHCRPYQGMSFGGSGLSCRATSPAHSLGLLRARWCPRGTTRALS